MSVYLSRPLYLSLSLSIYIYIYMYIYIYVHIHISYTYACIGEPGQLQAPVREDRHEADLEVLPGRGALHEYIYVVVHIVYHYIGILLD